MTLATETTDLMKAIYRAHELNREGFTIHSDLFAATLAACKAIASASRTRQTWAEKACNGVLRYDSKAGMTLASWTDLDEAAKDRADAKAAARIQAALAAIYGPTWAEGITLELQNDPRGAMVKLFTKGTENSGNAQVHA
jgi:hypothetical protein